MCRGRLGPVVRVKYTRSVLDVSRRKPEVIVGPAGWYIDIRVHDPSPEHCIVGQYRDGVPRRWAVGEGTGEFEDHGFPLVLIRGVLGTVPHL